MAKGVVYAFAVITVCAHSSARHCTAICAKRAFLDSADTTVAIVDTFTAVSVYESFQKIFL